ncbi:unnamed protein product [Acanthoscelides obtectus]|uniref:AT-rich interactive domain-containing protein 2 n=2 Tax=Acanthoscelides obtectus TaxID=200917 RepID=A0A9P0P3R0_ACAOB|nr:unnamed protein product [Acanthoscelides obtectus]CAK1683180.1 AT-rich interactive domain-containing protein 2 [Acanthoscelides obtectus]
MANILGKDPATYSKERDGFLRDLQHFHETRGTPYKRPPSIGGKEVDLYLLYSLVTSHGGWLKVNFKNIWPEIFTQLELPRSCVNGSVALKQIYLRYLDRWEKVHFLHEDGDRVSDDDEEGKHKKLSAKILHSVASTYNYSQHNVSDTNREVSYLSTNLYRPSDYDRLALSLVSPLPNEQDFSINVCTLLSNDGKHTLRLRKHPRIVNYLLAHAGVFSHSSLRQLFTHFYSDIRKKPIHTFWKDVVESKEFLRLTNEDEFNSRRDAEETVCDMLVKDDTTSSLLMEVDVQKFSGDSIDVESVVSDSDEISMDTEDHFDSSLKFKITESDKELFCLKRSLGTQDYIGQRVLQIATILRNLSFIEENMVILSKNTTFLRFCLLCCTAQWGILKNLGMDMLGNVAPEFIIRDLSTDILAADLLKIVTRGLTKQDRACCLSSLEVLNKLSQNEQNEDVLLRSLEASVYRNVCSFLTIHDVMLLIYTLECLYSLSSLGERSCHFIVVNHGVIDTLVSLVTVEGKSYGPKACIGMKLVETVPAAVSGSTAIQQQQQQPQKTPAPPANTTTGGEASTSALPSSSGPIAVKVTPPSTPTRPVAIVPHRLLSVAPSPTVAASVASDIPVKPTAAASTISTVIQDQHKLPNHQQQQQQPAAQPQKPQVTQPHHQHPLTPQQLIQQQHAHQQAIHENEQFALAWLRATYEPCESGKIDHQELYKHYINSCTSIGRRGVISPLHFPRCVRSVFGGTVGPNPMKPANPNDPQFYEGIKVRNNISIPLQQNEQTQPLNVASSSLSEDDIAGGDVSLPPPSPASPILKAQLSAAIGTKHRESVFLKGDHNSQAVNHPHLSQALLGSQSSSSTSSTAVSAGANGTQSTLVTTTTTTPPVTSAASGQASSTSLIKSLLATKVNDCMSSTVSMRTATDYPNVAQVAARQQQQRLLAQVGCEQQPKTNNQQTIVTAVSRVNGMRQISVEEATSVTDAVATGDSSVSSTTSNSINRENTTYLAALTPTSFTDATKGKKEPPQPPPPPLAPLSNGGGGMSKTHQTRPQDSEDSDSIEANSIASISGAVGISGIFSTEDGDNSLTCFEGLLNGIHTMENPLNEDSNSKDSVKIIDSEISINKPLRLADLLEKKFEKSPPLLNGSLGRDLKVGEKDLLENHIEKALNRDSENDKYIEIKIEDESTDEITLKEEPLTYTDIEMIDQPEIPSNLKRSLSDEALDGKSKKAMFSMNGNSNSDSPNPDSVSSSNDEAPATVSTAAAKLFADIAADILEDEDEEQLLQEAQSAQPATQSLQIATQGNLPQIIMDNSQQVLLGQRQIIVSQPQMVISAGAPVKTQSGQAVIVQNSSGVTSGGQQRQMLIQQAGGQHVLLSQPQMQLVATSSAGGQPTAYVQQGAYVVAAQSQTAVVHGQPQTVLVAQAQQQQGGGPPKTIIILQQQQQVSGSAGSPVQKVVMTPQGQQVVVAQIPRQPAHTTTVSNNTTVISTVNKTSAVKQPVMTNALSQPRAPTPTQEKKKLEVVKKKPVRDLTTPYVCEWGECDVATKFRSPNEVFLHACSDHCPTGTEEVLCEWDKCDNLKRKRFSLMTHIQDKHCSAEAMKQSLLRRKQTAQGVKVESSQPTSTTPHPGYAPDAAIHAIKRHALEFVNPKELQDDNEGPVTKSIRLTASLILRNLVIYSSHCKRYLKSHESHLANVALSNVESSRTIAQVLYDMNDGTTHR